MLNNNTALTRSSLLSSAAGELLKDAALEALRPDPDERNTTERFLQLGEDVAVLARAIGVLHRRAGHGGGA